MKANYCKRKYCVLGLTMGLSALAAGCATMPSSTLPPSYQLADVEGRWSWIQNPWHGDFVLTRDGDLCTGILNDVYEGTYGDKIVDVIISDNRLKFTRNGRYSIQYWEGTLTEEDGVLKIKDGRWTKVGRSSGSFVAEKKE